VSVRADLSISYMARDQAEAEAIAAAITGLPTSSYQLLQITSSAGSGQIDDAGAFVPNPMPATVTSLTPASTSAALTSLTLTVYGSGFVAGVRVTVGGVSFPAPFVIDPGQLTLSIDPSVLGVGQHAVAVLVPLPPSAGYVGSNEVTLTVGP
jgi:hypothetical protein